MKVDQANSGKYHIMAEINMVPFIDVVLVLLIIFMVITPILVKSQIKVDVPVTRAANPTDDKEKPTQVQIQKDGTITIDGGTVSEESLEKIIKLRVIDPEKHAVIIEADKNVSFQHVVTVMGAAKKIGITKIAVKVMEEKRAQNR